MDKYEARFWSKVEKTNGCWHWKAGRLNSGYGHFWTGAKMVMAHRYAYEKLVGPIPAGLTLDHLCRVRHCVRPEHLVVATNRENILAGDGPAAVGARQTHCLAGHDLNDSYVRRLASGENGRNCRKCQSRRSAEYYKRKTA